MADTKIADAPPAEAEGLHEFVLPEGEDGKVFLEAAEVLEADPEGDAPPAKPEAPAAVAKAEPAQPDAKPAESKGSVKAALREEREKRKRLSEENQKLKALWSDIEADRERARQYQQRTRTQPKEIKVSIDRAAIKAKADAASTSGDIADVIAQEMETRLADVARQAKEQAKQEMQAELAEERRTRIADQEERMRDKYPDYDDRLTKADIWAATRIQQDGTYADPIIAHRIYSSPNPPRMAYEIARAKLAAVAPADQDDPEDDVTPEPAPPARPAAAPAADELVEAERRGARHVIERVHDNATRPRGIRVLADAGQPTRAQVSFRALDALRDRDPVKWDRVVESLPDAVKRAYLSG